MAQTAIMAVLSDINCPLSGCLYASTAHTGIKSLSREHEGTLTQTELAIIMQIPLSVCEHLEAPNPGFPQLVGFSVLGVHHWANAAPPFV